MTNKKDLSERDICTKFITPALEQAGWDMQKQVREEVGFTDGRIYVKGNLTTRGKRKRADYILYYKPNIPVAIIEAKDNKHSVMAGIQQGLDYATILDIPTVFSSNGDGFYEHDRTAASGSVERELPLHDFPTPEQLWERYKRYKGITTPEAERISAQDYFFDGTSRNPRYYQQIAINRTVEAIAKGQQRILLTMATGTGKTYTAFQIIHRLWKAGAKKRILFLADRNALIDQTRRGDFRHFKDKMTVIKQKKIDKSYEIYLALYQGLTNYDEDKDAYREFSPDFFDLIVIDECHRGSASEDSAWREILDYFKTATHIGLTATPKETEDVSNSHYFGDPIYSYSLRQGIEDGFLAPYTVIRYDLDKDLFGWRPSRGMLDKYGNLIEDRIYNLKDIDRKLVLEARTELVSKLVSEFLRETNRFDKTIVFCDNIDHAERMRQALVNENSDLVAENAKYVMRITGDSEEGKDELDNFIFPESKYPVIATTSKLMSTGVDAQTCKLIVLDQHIQSMTEFKQIIGRGTRVNEEYDKYSFTIIDFKKATELFADKDFDGDPVQIYSPGPGDPPVPPEEPEGIPPAPDGEKPGDADTPDDIIIVDPPFGGDEGEGGGDPPPPSRYVIDKHNVKVALVQRRVQYMDAQGKLITESIRDYTRKSLRREYASLDDFLNIWRSADRKKTIIEALEQQGIFFSALEEEVGRPLDPFDLVCHVAWDMPPLTRKERAENVRKRHYFAKYGDQARAVLEALLDKYADVGVEHIEDTRVLSVSPFTTLGTPVELTRLFGGKAQYLAAVRELEELLYAS